MSHTNSTTNYGLPQWIGSDKPTFLGDFNSAFNTIDGQMKQNSTDAGQAISTANSANATAMDAAERSITAKSTADTAKDTADAANALATTASNTATVAKNTADEAARTAEANNIGNLAPAYDPTLTYNVGDLVTYIDENNSGKLYKCIVAWETPGEFNINYWDDVTVSEEINAHRIIRTVTGNSNKTNTQMIVELLENLNISPADVPFLKLVHETLTDAKNRYTFYVNSFVYEDNTLKRIEFRLNSLSMSNSNEYITQMNYRGDLTPISATDHQIIRNSAGAVTINDISSDTTENSLYHLCI